MNGMMEADDPFQLQRFVSAQAPVYSAVVEELRTGRKRTHWMWFIFPQLLGLGNSPMAQRYAIGSMIEAGAYLAHPVLGPRLVSCTLAVLDIKDRSLNTIFGTPDDVKFHSSMTLFLLADDADSKQPFRAALDRFWAGTGDARTIALVAEGAKS